MPQSSEFAPKITSGVDVVDRAWGGLFRGGSYLVYGRVSNGRGLLALAFEQAGVAVGERAMFVSNSRQKDLLIQSTAIGFNVAEAGRDQLFRHVRTNDLSPANREDVGARIDHLIDLILEFKPARLVVNDLVSLINVGKDVSLGDFQKHFVKLLEQIEPIDTTALFTLPDPGNKSARKLAEYIMSRCAGAIHVGPREADTRGYRLTLLPQIGHVTRRTTVAWPLHDVVAQFEDIEGSYRLLKRQATDVSERLDSDRKATVEVPLPEDQPVVPDAPVTPDQSLLEMTTTTETVAPSTIDDLATGIGPVESYPTALTLEEAQSGVEHRRLSSVVSTKRSVSDFQSRTHFRSVLESQYEKVSSHGGQFLLVAMRVDPSRESVRPFDFEFLSSVVLATLRAKDEAFVDLQRERLVILFPDSTADDSQEFFSRVRARLRRDAPHQATHLLNLVSAIVVPNGNPFNDADGFLKYVLDSN
ncbi:MAG: hypothetical protein HKN13_11575 [Rhodothermales bacterium]|nr:hypothetical protein [Rhodothermales bacterium]